MKFLNSGGVIVKKSLVDCEKQQVKIIMFFLEIVMLKTAA